VPISQKTIQEVQNVVQIEEVVADFLPLKGRICGRVALFTKKSHLLFLYRLPKASINVLAVMLLAMPSPLYEQWRE
jgi:hypothetical protein